MATTLLNRVKQVIAAVTAKVTAADRLLIAENLNSAEQALFFGMNLPDQRHALNVAYTALSLVADGVAVNKRQLVKSALLHDVGKVRGDVSTWDKIVTVVVHQFAPERAESWGRYGRGGRLANLRHAFYIYFHHAERGAEMLAAIGEERSIVGIIRKHHQAPEDDDPVELSLLRQADNLN